MSKQMKNMLSSGIGHGGFQVRHYHLLYVTELPAGIIQRLHARTSVTLKMASAHFFETSCQPRNLYSVKTGLSSDESWGPGNRYYKLMDLCICSWLMRCASNATEWILPKKKKTENCYSRGVFLKCLQRSVRRKTWLCKRVLFWIRIHILKLKLQYMWMYVCMYICMHINIRSFQNIRNIFATWTTVSLIWWYEAQTSFPGYGCAQPWIMMITSNLSNDRSKSSCKTVPPHSAI